MRVGVIGSRGLTVNNLEKYLPMEVTAIVSGGARGIDSCAAKWAQENNIELIEFLPEYNRFGRSAPLRRNITIIDNSDIVLAFWDLKSRGTAFVIKKCAQKGVPVRIYTPSQNNINVYIPYNGAIY